MSNELKTNESKPIILSKSDILAALAYCAVKQSPYDFPKNLQVALEKAAEYIDGSKVFESNTKLETKSYKHFTDDELYKFVKDIIFNVKEIALWNVTKIEQDNGITDPEDPNRSVKFSFVSRNSCPAPDLDFIDLDALHRNVLNMLYSD